MTSMKDRAHMTRICSACGIEKPLAAFLEISSTHGTHYGNLCSACRGAGITEKKSNKTEEEQSTIATSGSRIGLKERVFLEKEQKKQLVTAKEQRIEELNKRDALLEEKKEKISLKEKLEKNHRNTYLDTKKQPSFLNKTLPSANIEKTPPSKTLPLQTNIEQNKVERDKVAREKLTVDEKQRVIEARQEEMKNTFNFVDQYIDPRADEARGYSPAFLTFRHSIGVEAPINAFEKIRQRLKELDGLKTSKAPENTTHKKDPLLDFVEKTWSGPSSPRKR
jgi:hypothetical protein